MTFKKILFKTIISFIFIPYLSQSQNITTFSQIGFQEELESFFNNPSFSNEEAQIKKETIKNYQNLGIEVKSDFINLINSIPQNRSKEVFFFLNYFNWLNNGNLKKTTPLKKILLYHYIFLFNNNLKSTNYFEVLWEKINSKTLISRSTHKIFTEENFKIGVEDFLDFSLYDNVGGLLGTLVFTFKNADIFVETEFHDFNIINPSFNYYPDIEILQGENGKLISNIRNLYFGETNFALKNFSIDLEASKIVSPITFLTSGKFKNVQGALEYFPPISESSFSNHFDFISFDSDINLILNNNIRLRSGISIEGDKFYTKSLSNSNSEIIFIINNGKRISIKSKSFILDDLSISSSNSYFKFYDDYDSLYHSMVAFDYNTIENKIQVLNIKGTLRNTAFYSSYFDIEFTPDVLNYKLGDDKIYFGMIVASNQRPLSVFSKNYFSSQKLNEMTDLNGINILKATYTYFSKIRRTDFYINDLSYYFKTKKSLIEGGIINLWRNGFIVYDRGTGLIKILPKLRHYYLSHLKKSDYDEFSFGSLSINSDNLVYDLSLNTMTFKGVKEITLSKKNNIILFPKYGEVELRKNREVRTIGDLSVGNFDFSGVQLTFDYDKYFIDLIEIDTLKMLSKNNNRDSYNYLYNIGGDLFINHPKNKSSRRNLQKFPSFISDKSTKVYFDMPEDYGYEYDSSFYFSIDQFRIDSLDKSSLPKFEFPGTFYSHNIFSPIEGNLITMPDNSFGFNMTLDENGLDAYNKKIKVYNNLLMDSTGLYTQGNIKYNTTMLFSDKIRLFPDSLTGVLDKGFMTPGNTSKNTFQYPELVLSGLPFSYYNLNDDYIYFQYDSSELHNVKAYNQNVEIIGDVYVYSNSVFSEGSIKTNNSSFVSDEFNYNKSFVVSEYTNVILNHIDYSSGLLKGNDLFFKYDINENIIELKSSFYDERNFELPSYYFTTSLNEATWNIDENFLMLTSNNGKQITYPYDDRFNNWNFVIESFLVDLSQKTVFGSGVEEVQIADAYIIPENKELVITEGFNIQPLKNSVLILDTISEFHRFVNSEVKINSKRSFEGRGVYEYVNFNLDTFNIPFSEFEIKESIDGTKTSSSRGDVAESKPILMEPGFNFYGSIELLGNSEQLLFDGRILPSEIEDFQKSNAIPFNDYFVPGDELALSLSEDKDLYNAAISKSDEVLYFDFFNNPVDKKSLVFFNPKGLLSYDPFTKEYLIETQQKRDQDVYNGNSLLYNPLEKNVAFEGNVNLFREDNNFKLFTSMTGAFNLDSMNIESEAFMILDVNLKKSIIDELGFAFNDIIETYGAPIAHDNEQDVLSRLSDIIGNTKIVAYENTILSEYKSLVEADGLLNSLFVFSNTPFSWSQKDKAWYNTSTVNLSNIGPRDVNAAIDGFVEVKYINEYESLFTLFLQPAPELWVYISYDGNNLTTFSSNERYNSEMLDSSRSRDKFIPIKVGEESIVLDYINSFRLNYFGIKEPYDLMSPSDTFLEDEVFKTISDDDDGF